MDSPVTIPISTPFNIDVVHVEISSKCTLKCPRCPRTELSPSWLNQEISLEDFRAIFPPEVLGNISYLLFCGHTGDPIYAGDCLDIVQYVKQNSRTRIRLVTNGSYRKPDWWQRLGLLLDDDDGVIFSIDGWDHDSNNLYRVNSDWPSIMLGMQTLRSNSTCLIEWSMIYFSFNQDRKHDILAQARTMGCDQVTLVRSSKFDLHYAVDGHDALKPSADLVAQDNNYQRERHTLRRPEPFGITSDRRVHAWAKCLNHAKEVNVVVDGTVHPCSWFNSGYQQNDFVDRYRDRLDARRRGLKAVLEDPIWSELTDRFDLDICRIKCKNAKI